MTESPWPASGGDVPPETAPSAAGRRLPFDYFDGDSPYPQPADLRLSPDRRTALILREGLAPVGWPVEKVRRIADQATNDTTVLRMIDDPLARLVARETGLPLIFPALDRRAPPKGRLRLAGWAAAAVTAVALQIAVLIPIMADQLADYLPPAGEQALGEATLDQIRSALDETGMEPLPFCEDPAGLDALEAMRASLTAGTQFDVPIKLYVLDHDMINAFALPGSYVVLFRGLIDEAERPEEVAAVLAHEIGHVVSRDPTRHALRSAGSIGILGLLFGDFAGGAVVLLLAEQLIDAQYSQDAEAAADVFARDLMAEAGIDPSGLATFFERLRDRFGETNGFVSHFMAHPTLGDRIAASREGLEENRAYRPVLTDRQWENLRDICY